MGSKYLALILPNWWAGLPQAPGTGNVWLWLLTHKERETQPHGEEEGRRGKGLTTVIRGVSSPASKAVIW